MGGVSIKHLAGPQRTCVEKAAGEEGGSEHRQADSCQCDEQAAYVALAL
jgi:hypothetical protein